jgi:uncharacterized damage-inducible protein DinB
VNFTLIFSPSTLISRLSGPLIGFGGAVTVLVHLDGDARPVEGLRLRLLAVEEHLRRVALVGVVAERGAARQDLGAGLDDVLVGAVHPRRHEHDRPRDLLRALHADLEAPLALRRLDDERHDAPVHGRDLGLRLGRLRGPVQEVELDLGLVAQIALERGGELGADGAGRRHDVGESAGGEQAGQREAGEGAGECGAQVRSPPDGSCAGGSDKPTGRRPAPLHGEAVRRPGTLPTSARKMERDRGRVKGAASRRAADTLVVMDYVELFERQGRLFDDLLMAAAGVPEEDFLAPGPHDGPSLRDLLVAIVDLQRRHVHEALQGRRHVALQRERIRSPLELGPVFGGFRLTLLDAVDALEHEDLTREVALRTPDGAERRVTLDEVLVHMVLSDARLRGLAAERLRQLGVAVRPMDPLDSEASDGTGAVPEPPSPDEADLEDGEDDVEI